MNIIKNQNNNITDTSCTHTQEIEEEKNRGMEREFGERK